MPYKISGTLSDAARIIVLKESDWSIESNTEESNSAYTVEDLAVGKKFTIARKSDGEVVAYGDVDSVYYVPPPGDRGLFGGGNYTDTIDYITISSTGNASDFGDLYTGLRSLASTSNGSNNRGVFGGGETAFNKRTTLVYVTIITPSNSTSFGNLTQKRSKLAGTSNATGDRGVFGGGNDSSDLNIIDYITISSIGDATDFGDLRSNRYYHDSAISNGTNDRGVFGGCWDVDDYITISSTGNASDFGNLTQNRRLLSAVSNGTNNRGVFIGGFSGGSVVYNIMDYITISSIGDATDFGDLATARGHSGSADNSTNNRGVTGGGLTTAGGVMTNEISYITVTSTGNSTDFGDLSAATKELTATSNA
ncbi:MAG: hypothetical protein DRO67_05660 [Candidatus Asgardarchaeum californiense]|nr:MAG: hypothetical protein DRO67_05660 [Candidatus Asgardarchaeum californiense]